MATRKEKDQSIKQDIAWIAKLEPNKINNINHHVHAA
jgi:hypothetical protein